MCARRRDTLADGRLVAGELGDLFLTTDGVLPVFDWQEHEVHGDGAAARAAWERARVRTWRHPDRATVFPPAGAVWDGLVSRVERLGPDARREVVAAAVAADRADVEAFRRSRPDAAAAIVGELGDYLAVLDRVAAGVAGAEWLRLVSRGGVFGGAAQEA